MIFQRDQHLPTEVIASYMGVLEVLKFSGTPTISAAQSAVSITYILTVCQSVTAVKALT